MNLLKSFFIITILVSAHSSISAAHLGTPPRHVLSLMQRIKNKADDAQSIAKDPFISNVVKQRELASTMSALNVLFDQAIQQRNQAATTLAGDTISMIRSIRFSTAYSADDVDTENQA